MQCRCVSGGVGCWRAVGVVLVAEGVPELSGLGVLTWVYPPDLVDRVVAACGRAEQRRRLLPARLVVYFVLALALFWPAPYLEVLRHLTEGLRDLGRWGSWRMPAKSSLVSRPGAAGRRAVAGAVRCHGPAAGHAVHAWGVLAGSAADGGGRVVLGRGRHASQRQGVRASRHPPGRGWRGVSAGTHGGAGGVRHPRSGRCRAGRLPGGRGHAGGAGGPLGRAGDAGAGRPGVPWGAAVAGRGRHRGAPAVAGAGQPGLGPRAGAAGRVVALAPVRGRDRPARRDPVRVRVVAYALADPGRTGAGEYRLVTDLLDHQRYPAEELAALYAQRWEQETALDELKTHQRGPGVVLTSKTPDGVRQQVWAHLLVHHALRALMCRTAGTAGVDCDRLSFVDTLRAVRRSVTASPGVFSP